MVEYAIKKKSSTKVIFWKKLHKFLLEKIKRNNYFITFPKLIDRSCFYTSINFNSDITYMKNNVSISNLDNFIISKNPQTPKENTSISQFKEVIQIRSFYTSFLNKLFLVNRLTALRTAQGGRAISWRRNASQVMRPLDSINGRVHSRMRTS